jgi:hypothetical protein
MNKEYVTKAESDYKKVILSTNYTSQRNAGSSPDPPDQNSLSY